MTSQLSFASRTRPDGTPVLAVTGEIDMGNAAAFGAALAGALPAAGRLEVDLTGVGYLDTAGLACLFSNASAIEVTVTEVLSSVLAISGLADLTAVTRVSR
jgi:anti-sigma B factor antagonist